MSNMWAQPTNLVKFGAGALLVIFILFQISITRRSTAPPPKPPPEPRDTPLVISPASGIFGVSVPTLQVGGDGKFIFPPSVKRIWFDVGAHERAMYTRSSLDEQDDLAVIAFEPMYDKWGTLVAQNGHDRLYPLPAAVSTQEGFLTFRRAATDMCSSLSDVDEETQRKDWPGGCAETKYKIKVPAVRLESIVDRLPIGRIDFIKIDAQGNDFDVVRPAFVRDEIKSLGRHLNRVFMIAMEIQVNKPLYKDAPTLEDVTTWMDAHGFEREKAMLQGPNERNLLFKNKEIDEREVDLGKLPLREIFKPNKWADQEAPEGRDVGDVGWN